MALDEQLPAGNNPGTELLHEGKRLRPGRNEAEVKYRTEANRWRLDFLDGAREMALVAEVAGHVSLMTRL